MADVLQGSVVTVEVHVNTILPVVRGQLPQLIQKWKILFWILDKKHKRSPYHLPPHLPPPPTPPRPPSPNLHLFFPPPLLAPLTYLL